MLQPEASLRIKISGEAGDGIITVGDVVMRSAARQGYHSSQVKTFPSNIRGGYSQTMVTIAPEPVVAYVGACSLVCSLSVESLLLDTCSTEGMSLVLVEAELLAHSDVCARVEALTAAGVVIHAVPVVQLARETAGNCMLRSTIVAGVLSKLLGFNKKIVEELLHEHFAVKGPEINELNRIAFNSGHLWARHYLPDSECALPKISRRAAECARLVLDGNQAVALGAVAAGCSFYASYPITPATSAGEVLSTFLIKTGGFAYQAEDEIAALGAVIGASFSGVKAMTATSGPGLSLMQEFIGYASMVELPVVIVDVQRAGPSTGMPTKHSQDDLNAAVYGGHGEGPRIVVAPLNVEDCFHCTVDAFNIAESHQCPVIMLSDGSLSVTRTTVTSSHIKAAEVVTRRKPSGSEPQDEPFSRYSPVDGEMTGRLPEPGMKGFAYCATGIEHNADSTPVTRPAQRSAQMERRFGKLSEIEHQFKNSAIKDFPESATKCDIGVCAWGFTAASTAAAVTRLRQQGFRVAALYPRLLYPLCTDALAEWFTVTSLRVVIEANYQEQYCRLVQSQFPEQLRSFTVYRGEPFLPEEIEKELINAIESQRMS